MVIRVLVVEDGTETLEEILIALDLSLLSQDERDKIKERYGIDNLLVKHASNAVEAKRLLIEATEPFDVLLLDLRLPEHGLENEKPLPSRGLKILETARERRAAKEVLIYSELSRYIYAVEAFLKGAVDYLNKRFPPGEELRTRVLSSGARVLAKESAHIFNERIKWLVPYAEKGLAHRFGTHFSRFVQSIVHEMEGLEKELKERLKLDLVRDSQDPVVRRLASMGMAVKDSKREWTELQSSLGSMDESPKEELVGDLLDKIKDGLLPCLTVKRVELKGLQQEEVSVLSFGKDVQTVLKEIIIGGLSEIPENIAAGASDTKRAGQPDIAVSVNKEKEWVEVRFIDTLKRIPRAATESINEGFGVPPDERFGRAWGLSVAQHIAMLGGGRLTVNSQEDEEPQEYGNVITYLIPRFYYA